MSTPNSSAVRALALEYKSLQEEPVEGFRVKLVNEDNLFEWEVAIFGPPDTLYQGGYFKVSSMVFACYPIALRLHFQLFASSLLSFCSICFPFCRHFQRSFIITNYFSCVLLWSVTSVIICVVYFKSRFYHLLTRVFIFVTVIWRDKKRLKNNFNNSSWQFICGFSTVTAKHMLKLHSKWNLR